MYASEYPGRLKGLELCDPMFSINTKPIPNIISRMLVKGMNFFGLSKAYIWGGGQYDPGKKFTGNDLSHSKERFELNKTIIGSFPQAALGSPTFGWLNQSFSAMSSIRNSSTGVAELPPILLLSGTEDSVVGFGPQKDICESVPNCQLQRIAGAKHELLMEKDSIRDEVFRMIVEFVETTIK